MAGLGVGILGFYRDPQKACPAASLRRPNPQASGDRYWPALAAG